MAKVTVYEMEMQFELTLSIRSVNDLLSSMGLAEKLVANGNILTVKQTLPVIPNEEYIAAVAEAIKNAYTNEKSECVKCKFIGYKSFLEREIDVPEENEN